MKLSMSIPAVLSLCVGALQAQQERTFERTLNVPAPVTLDLWTDAGGIVVTQGPAGVVRIRGILKAQRGSFFDMGNVEDRIRQLADNPPVRQSGDTVLAGHVAEKSLLKGISMRLEIQAPAESRVRARADSGGIRVEGVRGPVDCKTDSGGIHASDIGAETRAEADSGGIHLRGIRGPVHARADSGGIEALEVAGSIDAKTDSGGIRLSQTSAGPVRAQADSGGVTLRLAQDSGYDLKIDTDSGRFSVPEMTMQGALSKHHVQGKVRGGGPLVDIRVSSGNVDVR